VPVSAADSSRPPHRRTFQLLAGLPALDFVNTLDWRFRDNPTELIETYEDLVGFCGQAGVIPSNMMRRLLSSISPDAAARELARARQLREASAAVLYAMLDGHSPDSAPVRLLETIFRSARRHQQLLWASSGMAWELARDGAASQLPVLLAVNTEALLTSGQISMVRACDDPECRWLFLDTSKNHTRRWCDMKICGNRMKARRFKALHEH
jgi:predicted RNA-binding Zn ribbon-like protein